MSLLLVCTIFVEIALIDIAVTVININNSIAVTTIVIDVDGSVTVTVFVTFSMHCLCYNYMDSIVGTVIHINYSINATETVAVNIHTSSVSVTMQTAPAHMKTDINCTDDVADTVININNYIPFTVKCQQSHGCRCLH